MRQITATTDDQLMIIISAASPIPDGNQINAGEIARIHAFFESIASIFRKAGCKPVMDAVIPNRKTQCYEVLIEPDGQFSLDAASQLVEHLEHIGKVANAPKTWTEDQLKLDVQPSLIKRFVSLGDKVRKIVEDKIVFGVTGSKPLSNVTVSPRPKADFEEAKLKIDPPTEKEYDQIVVEPVASFSDDYVVSRTGDPAICRHSEMRDRLKNNERGKWTARKAKRTIEAWVLYERLDDDDESQQDLDI